MSSFEIDFGNFGTTERSEYANKKSRKRIICVFVCLAILSTSFSVLIYAAVLQTKVQNVREQVEGINRTVGSVENLIQEKWMTNSVDKQVVQVKQELENITLQQLPMQSTMKSPAKTISPMIKKVSINEIKLIVNALPNEIKTTTSGAPNLLIKSPAMLVRHQRNVVDSITPMLEDEDSAKILLEPILDEGTNEKEETATEDEDSGNILLEPVLDAIANQEETTDATNDWVTQIVRSQRSITESIVSMPKYEDQGNNYFKRVIDEIKAEERETATSTDLPEQSQTQIVRTPRTVIESTTPTPEEKVPARILPEPLLDDIIKQREEAAASTDFSEVSPNQSVVQPITPAPEYGETPKQEKETYKTAHLPEEMPTTNGRAERSVTLMHDLGGSVKTLKKCTKKIAAAHYNGDSSSFDSHLHEVYSENSHSSHYTDWKKSGWVTDNDQNKFFNLNDGVVTIKKIGIYFVYAQVYYLDVREVNAYRVYKNEDVLLQCTSSTFPQGGRFRGNTCFTAGIASLEKGDNLTLSDYSGGRYSIFKPGKTFFGVFRLGKGPK